MTTGLLLVQYTDGGTVRAGVRHDGVVRALPPNWPGTVLGILDAWPEWDGQLRALDPRALPVVPDARLAAPVTFPRKILCAGANYYSHAEEMGTARPDPPRRAVLLPQAPDHHHRRPRRVRAAAPRCGPGL